LQARLIEARIHVQIDVGFADAITPAATDLDSPTLLADMPSPNVLAYPTETTVAEKVEAMVHLGLSNSRMKDFTDLAIAARRTAFEGSTLAAAIRATFRRRGTLLPESEIVALSEQFVQDSRAQANWKAYVKREGLRGLNPWRNSSKNYEHFFPGHRVCPDRRDVRARWTPGGPWI
jgi:hypothetical protein